MWWRRNLLVAYTYFPFDGMSNQKSFVAFSDVGSCQEVEDKNSKSLVPFSNYHYI